jgi:hypothetical protein
MNDALIIRNKVRNRYVTIKETEWAGKIFGLRLYARSRF